MNKTDRKIALDKLKKEAKLEKTAKSILDLDADQIFEILKNKIISEIGEGLEEEK